MGPPRLTIAVPSRHPTERCLRAAGLGDQVRAVQACRAAGATTCTPTLTTAQAAAAAKRLHGLAGCHGARRSLLARPAGPGPATGDGAPAPAWKVWPVPPTAGKTEIRVRSPLEERIEGHRVAASRDFPAAATRLRQVLAERGVVVTDADQQAALAHADAALRNATIVQFQKVAPTALRRLRRQGGTTPLFGGARTLLSKDGRTIYYAFDVPGNSVPGGLHDSDSGRIFVNGAFTAGSQGSAVFAHEAAHAYLHRLGVASRDGGHHDLMAQCGLTVVAGAL